jgi:signal transduction histidine kinase
MPEAWGRGLLRLLLCLAPLAAQVHAAEPLHLEQAQMMSVPAADDAVPQVAQPQDMPGRWQAVTLPYAFPPLALGTQSTQLAEDASVVTWYRVKLPVLAPSAERRYLYLPRWKCNGHIAVYADQRLLLQSNADQFWNGWNTPLWIPLNETAGVVSPVTIYLRIEHPSDAGGGISTLWLGERAQLSWRYHLRYWLQVRLPFMCSIAFLTAGVFSLLLWLRKRSETLHLLFFLMALASIVRTVIYLIGNNPLLMSWEWSQWWSINALLWLITVVHFFLNQLHLRPSPRSNRGLLILVLALALLTLPLFAQLPDRQLPLSLAHIAVFLTGIVVGLAGFRRSQRAQSKEGMLLGAWCLMIVLFELNDSLRQDNHLHMEGAYLGPYANLVAFLIFLFTMVRRYTAAINAVLQLNASLAQRLAQREAELQVVHAAQREAAHRQTLVTERQRMMQDMHDGMGSSLRSALLAVEAGRMAAPMVADVLKDCIDDLKLAIDAMEPVEADLLLLLATLRFRLGPRLEGAGIALRWEVENVPDLDWLDPRNALHILRILQEVFTNIIKHTRATEIRVTTAVLGDVVEVALTDNGQGFDVAKGLSSPGKGLNNQLRRAQAIGAEIHWDSSPTGVCVRLRLPIHR